MRSSTPWGSSTAPRPVASRRRWPLPPAIWRRSWEICCSRSSSTPGWPQEAGRFTLADVARGVHDKLVHRHPHVFGDADAASADEVRANWEQIKRAEKGRSSVTEGIPADLPALLLSTKLQRKALSVGMAGPRPGDAGSDLAARLAALVAPGGRPGDRGGRRHPRRCGRGDRAIGGRPALRRGGCGAPAGNRP